MESKVALILVTYNRLDLLKESIKHILSQTLPVDDLFIVNNNSTDGTEKYLRELKKNEKNIHVKNLQDNIGGAGGFNEGIKFAYQNGNFDYYWLMDDDTFPESNALSELMLTVKKINEPIGFLSSNVVWKDDSPAIMNVPKVSKVWNENIDNYIVKLESGSFVSMLVSNDSIEKCGLPIKQFFIWGDDVEFSSRISNVFPSYFVINSKVLHYTKNNNGIDIFQESKNRINRYFYGTRNNMYRLKKQSYKEAFKFFVGQILLIFKIIFSKNCAYKTKKSWTIAKGLFVGLFFNPKIEYLINN